MQNLINHPSFFEQFKASFQQFPDAAFALNSEFRISFVNPAFTKLLGYSYDEVMGNSILNYLVDKSIFSSCKHQLEDKGECRDQETWFIKKDGGHIRVSKNVQLVTDSSEHFSVIVSLRDLTEVHKLNTELSVLTAQLKSANANLESLVAEGSAALTEQMTILSGYKSALDAAALVQKYSVNRSIIEVSPLMLSLLGYAEEDLLGKPWSFIWDEDSQKSVPDIISYLEQGKHWFGMLVCISASGVPVHLESSIVPIMDSSGNLREIVNLSYDVTYLINTTESLYFRLNYDALTDLANRNKLLADIDTSTTPTQVALLNIDSFNELNSYYGHKIADGILMDLASFLIEETRKDAIGVYKLPIDEFALVFTSGWSNEQLESYIAVLLEKILNRKFEIDNQVLSIGVTVGLASSLDLGTNVKNVVVAADMALKLAKRQRKPYVFFAQSLNIQQDYEHNLSWTKRLHQALEEDRVTPFFQPIVNSQTLKVDYYESLVRIVEEDGEVVSPIHFLEVAKKIKVYPKLTKTMIIKSFAHFIDKEVNFSINISIEDIANPVICDWIVEQVKDYPKSDRVIFEIVESEGIQNYEEVNDFITRVKKYGVKIAIDDFGAGYSNFIYIMRLDIDYLKIDGSIIRNIYDDESSQIITETLISFAKKMGIKTVAEFVADNQVYDYVKPLGIDSLQGYLFGKPSRDLLH